MTAGACRQHFNGGVYVITPACDSPNRPTYGMFLNLFTFLLTYTSNSKARRRLFIAQTQTVTG